jgi:hypothetical protein
VKKLAPVLCAAVALSMLGACATSYDGPRHGGHDAYYADAYYDGFYGAYDDGYWADDGFYFRDTADHPYRHADDASHFRRDANGGATFHHVQAHSKAPADRMGGEHKGGDHK